MVDDPELLELFKVESAEHLQNLEQGLLRLESAPTDHTLLEEVLRESHSLKGSSRMLGVTSVESLSHHYEDILKAAYKGEFSLDSAWIDRLEKGLDSLKALVHEAVTGEIPHIGITEAIHYLTSYWEERSASPTSVNASTPPPKSPGHSPSSLGSNQNDSHPILHDTTLTATVAEKFPQKNTGNQKKAVNPVESVENRQAPDLAKTPTPAVVNLITPKDKDIQNITTASTQTAAESSTAILPENTATLTNYRIDTIRVDTKKLDRLMMEAGELSVTRTRMMRWFEQFDLFQGMLVTLEQQVTHFYQIPPPTLSQHFTNLKESFQRFRQEVFDETTNLNKIAENLQENTHTLRLLPLSVLFNLFQRMVRDLAREIDKPIQFNIEGGNTTADKHLIEELKDPVMHLLRNAIDHGIESTQERLQQGKPAQALLSLRGYRTASQVIIEIEDDGRGLNTEKIRQRAIKQKLVSPEELEHLSTEVIHRFIFYSGFSTATMVTDLSGRGVGLDIVLTTVERLKGTVEIESHPGQGCRFLLKLPLTLSTTRVFLAKVAHQYYALPVEHVLAIHPLKLTEIFSLNDRQVFLWQEETIALAWLEHLLQLPPDKSPPSTFYCLILNLDGERLGVCVHEIVDELEITLKPMGTLLKRVRNVSGITLLGSGEICVVLNSHDLLLTARHQRAQTLPHSISTSDKPSFEEESQEPQENDSRTIILLVEDSITTRTQEKRILEGAGYEVVTAVDGLLAYQWLMESHPVHAIVSDIEMPNMDGLTLAAKVRQLEGYQDLPIILVTSLAKDEDKKRGMEAGADAYITKSAFNQQILLDTLRRLI